MDGKPRGFMFGIGDFETIDPEMAAAAEIDFSVGFDEVVDKAVYGAREWKSELVVNGPADLPDQCVVVLPQGSFHCPLEAMCEGMGIRAPDAIGISMKALRQAMGQPIAVMVLLETVYRGYADMIINPPQVGELSRRWHMGDQTIREALTVVVSTPTRHAMEFMPYHYGDGSIVWDDGGRHEYTTLADGWPEMETHENVAEAVRLAFSKEGGGDGTG